MRKCPICSVAVDRHKLMCLRHWRLVPAGLQIDVTEKWNRYRADLARKPRDSSRLLVSARALQSVQEAAIDAVRIAVTGSDA